MTDSIKRNKPFILGVAGGSGSGKTYFAQALTKKLGSNNCQLIYQDNFYIDQSHRFDFDGGSVNFDDPSSIDFKLLASHLKILKNGQETDIPSYDFATHSRRKETVHAKPLPIIIVDGILIFHAPEVRVLFDDLIFFDTPEVLRFARRLERDVKERGREAEGVKNQFLRQVKPMHDQYVEPSKTYSKTIVRELQEFDDVLKNYTNRLLEMISQ